MTYLSGIALSLSPFEDISQTIEEGFTVLVIFEDLTAFDSPGPIAPAKARGVIENYLYWHVKLNVPVKQMQNTFNTLIQFIRVSSGFRRALMLLFSILTSVSMYPGFQ